MESGFIFFRALWKLLPRHMATDYNSVRTLNIIHLFLRIRLKSSGPSKPEGHRETELLEEKLEHQFGGRPVSKPVKVDGWKWTPIEVTLLVKNYFKALKENSRHNDCTPVWSLFTNVALPQQQHKCPERRVLSSNQNILLSWSESSCLFSPPRLSMKRPSTATAPATCSIAATSPFELHGVVWATVHSITPKALRPSSHTALESRSAMYFAAT